MSHEHLSRKDNDAMSTGLDYSGTYKKVMTKTCRNCGTWMHWGIICKDCCRAWAIGFFTALGAGLAAWLIS